ncbi:MAG: hypothetical protein J6S44_03810, partial [Clostridia bacterium]|nr:hypothetical protein [Clostridia bacterium]
MTENGKKNFFDYFKHYKTDENTRQMLLSAEELKVRVAKDPLRIEVIASFPHVVRGATFYALEEELRVMYEAASFRFLPRFPAEEFRTEYMADVLEEAVRSNVITRGFFEEARYEDDGETMWIYLPFAESAVAFVLSSGTDEMLSNILRSRFSIDRKIKVGSDSNAGEKAILREQKRTVVMEEYDRKALEEFRRRMAEGSGEEPQAEDPHADFTKKASLSQADISLEKGKDTVYRIGNFTFDTEGSEVIYGDAFDLDKVVAINSVDAARGTVVFFGEVFSVETKESRDGSKLQVIIGICDGSSSIYVRKQFEKEDAGFVKNIKQGKCEP